MKLKQLQSALEAVRVFDSPDIAYEQYPTPPHLAAQIVLTMHRYGDVEGRAVADLGVGCGILTIASHLMGSSYNVGYDIDPAATAIARDNFARFDLRADLVHVDVSSMRWTVEGEQFDEQLDAAQDDHSEERRGRPTSRRGRKKQTRHSRGGGRGAVARDASGSRRKAGKEQPGGARAVRRRDDDGGSVSADDGSAVSGDDSAGTELSGPGEPEERQASETSSRCSSPPFPPALVDTVLLNPPFGTRRAGMDVAFLHVALQLARRAVYSLHKTSTRRHIAALCERWGVQAEVLAEMSFELKRSYSWHKDAARDVDVDLWRMSFRDDANKPQRFNRGRQR